MNNRLFQTQATRRRFTAAYKRKIVEEAAQGVHGEFGALLRREGLYSATVLHLKTTSSPI